MRGELIRQSADLAPAHGVRLPGDGKRPHAFMPDASAGKKTVDDGVGFIHPAFRLVHALRIKRYGLRRVGELAEKREHIRQRQLAFFRHALGRPRARSVQCSLKTLGVRLDVGAVDGVGGGQPGEQAVEQRGIRARFERQVQIGDVAGGGAAWVDHDHAHGGTGFFRRFDALVGHRMRPGGIRADQHDQPGFFQIFVTARHGIVAEGALVADHGGGHAQARIGVDIRRADVALHQFIGDVIIFGQQLAGNVEGDGLRTVLFNDAFEAIGHCVQRRVPVGAHAAHFRLEQTALQVHGFMQVRALDAQATEIRRVVFVAFYADQLAVFRASLHPATDAAVGASGQQAGGMWNRCHVYRARQ